MASAMPLMGPRAARTIALTYLEHGFDSSAQRH
jgi:hypothetical protein